MDRSVVKSMEESFYETCPIEFFDAVSQITQDYVTDAITAMEQEMLKVSSGTLLGIRQSDLESWMDAAQTEMKSNFGGWYLRTVVHGCTHAHFVLYCTTNAVSTSHERTKQKILDWTWQKCTVCATCSNCRIR